MLAVSTACVASPADDMHQGGLSERQAGHSPTALFKAVEFLAHVRSASFAPVDLMVAAPFRIVELLVLLHFNQRAASRRGVPSDVLRLSMLVVLELMTRDKGRGLLPTLLVPPSTARSFNFPAISRMLQHATLSLLSACEDRAAEVRRCCGCIVPLLT